MNQLLALAASIQPQLVIKAPDGEKLYLDVSPSADGTATETSLWPKGFTVGLDAGPVKADDPKITTNASAFFLRQSPTILSAPGFAGVSWGAWLFLLAVVAALPLVGIYLIRRK